MCLPPAMRPTVEMHLQADRGITMGCGGLCRYVPTTVDDWDIPLTASHEC